MTKTEHKLEIGTTLFLKNIQIGSRNEDRKIQKGKVTKIGRKFFEVEYYGRFFIDTMKEDGRGYSSRYQCYFTEKEILDQVRANYLHGEIRSAFNSFGDSPFTLEQLESVYKILNTKKDE